MSRQNWPTDKIYFRLLNNTSDKTYWDNIRELRSRANREIFVRCHQLAISGNDKEKKIAIDILAQLGLPPRPFYQETIKLCFDLLPTVTQPKLLSAILYAIGHNNQQLNTPQLATIALFKDNPYRQVRQAVVSAILHVQHKVAIRLLITLSTDKVAAIRSWATFGLSSQITSHTREITAALWNRIHDKDQDTRFEAIAGLATQKDIRLKAILHQELAADNFGSLLFEAIVTYEDITFLPLLKKINKTADSNREVSASWLTALQTCITTLEERKKLLS
ncbi:hypothetical protein [Chitinophaga nivalis]|uniref:HEAT repeat domain-containing protein n=1 Tax=Chitinophaga nivalis TaxID=2991709 RepID=A0ABT3IR41_9BACT|nr:hypothetical protein [Chitinophaga nivalis]MCW3463959.1 hypothetical protein [Chitinophaga nivalis]MCW3486351.1 hypothetical protein [Chitinophaga nivalis]